MVGASIQSLSVGLALRLSIALNSYMGLTSARLTHPPSRAHLVYRHRLGHARQLILALTTAFSRAASIMSKSLPFHRRCSGRTRLCFDKEQRRPDCALQRLRGPTSSDREVLLQRRRCLSISSPRISILHLRRLGTISAIYSTIKGDPKPPSNACARRCRSRLTTATQCSTWLCCCNEQINVQRRQIIGGAISPSTASLNGLAAHADHSNSVRCSSI